jgi:dipeptidyl aminopeptidase/acylaminoacyl peptidase
LLTFTLLAQRPLTLDDANSWNTILSQQLSPDGKWLAYALLPQEGDGSIVVRNLATGQEQRYPAGQRPLPGPKDPDRESPPPPPSNRLVFTADSHTLLAQTFPPKAEIDAARKAKKKPEDSPRNGLLVIDLASGKSTAIARVKSFQAGDDGGVLVAWQLEPAPAKPDKAKEEKKEEKPAAEAKPAEKDPTPSDLVLRNLSTGADRTFPSVVDYTLSKDGRTLVYTVFSKQQPEQGGLYAVDGDAAPVALLSGKGKYSRLTWDREQKQLALVSDRGSDSVYKLYLWKRGTAAAAELVSTATPGFRAGYSVSAKGPLSFSKDGARLFLSCAPEKPKAAKPADPDAERSVFDLWRWNDDHIPPMQKVRASRERDRSYRAVLDLASRRFLQLADPTMLELTPSEDGRFAIGTDDRPYRRSLEYDASRSDAYLVDTTTGVRSPLGQGLRNGFSWSPDGHWVVAFEDRQWYSIAVPSGTRTELTKGLGVAFFNETDDHPEEPGAWAGALWTRDSKWVLLCDRYDVWAVAVDGSSARNLTGGLGRREQIQFRLMRFPKDADDKYLDPAAPLLLRAEHQENYSSGFYRASFDGSSAPVRLSYGPQFVTAPIKARNADVYVSTASTFNQYPDLLVSDAGLQNFQRVSDANPQKKDFLWGSAEMMHFHSVDGVPLKAILYKPANFDPARKYPMIVYIYERLSQEIYKFSDPRPMHIINPAIYTSNGYIVLEPDISYTVGYPGPSAMKSVMPAVEAAVARGFVDEKSIGIQGHSWGGYQIAYMITQTTRFRAAAAGAIVSNMVSAYDGIRWGPGLPRQFQYERQQSRIGGSIWEFPERYLANSAIFQADRVQTPLLMIHNDADDAVPWYQGIEYFLALRRLNKEVYMFNYNGEPHGPRKRVNSKDYARRMMEFFDYHLKGAPAPDWIAKGIPAN